MNKLKKKIEKIESVEKVKISESGLPVYAIGAKQKKKLPVFKICIICIIAILILGIYLPPLFFPIPESGGYSSIALSPDESAKEAAIAHFRNNPSADFDGDGLLNELENSYGTNAYAADYDGDVVTDFAELYITNTNPGIYDDAIIDFIKADGSAVNEPFRVGDIILLADSYSSKARGSVIEMYEGMFRFSNFSGWAQFPEEGYAYSVETKGHTLLEKNANGAYRIPAKEGGTIVYFSTAPLEKCHIFSIFGSEHYLPDNFFARALSFILPSNGFGLLTCREATALDAEKRDVDIVMNPIVVQLVGGLEDERFERNMTALSDLNEIVSAIDRGDNVLLSLMSHTSGESIVEVYGYTSEYDLLVSDPSDGETLGVINIEIASTRMLDQSGTIQNYEYFSFSGCGYMSSQRHRLAIVGTLPAIPTPEISTDALATEPSDVTEEPPTKMTMDEDEMREMELQNKIAAIIHPAMGEEGNYYEGNNRFQITLNHVSAEELALFIETAQYDYGFGAYYEYTETERHHYTVLADAEGNVVTTDYKPAQETVTIRFERYDAEKTVELKPEFFIDG